MSVRSFTKIRIHLIWGTKGHEKSLPDREFRKKISQHLVVNSASKNIFMKINYVNADHVHTLIDLPTNKTIEDVAHLLKGELSSWINSEIANKFNWAIGYAAFPFLSQSLIQLLSTLKTRKNIIKEYLLKRSTKSFCLVIKLKI